MAARAGVELWDYSWRELVWMADEKDDAAWWHTASIVAAIANTARDPKKRRRPFSAKEFHPLQNRRRKPLVKLSPKESLALLKKAWVDKK